MQNHNIAVLEKRHYTIIPRSCLAAVHPQTAESANFTVEESVQYTVNYSSQRSLQLKQRDTPREGEEGGRDQFNKEGNRSQIHERSQT